MNKKTKKIAIISSCVLILLGIILSPKVSSADDLTVSGNGANSNNTVNVSSMQQTTPQQTNNSQVSNATNTMANTGNNSVSNNAANTSTVKTGDANITTTVNNTTNASTVNAGCGCNQGSTATVTGNGDNSTNAVNVSSNNSTMVSVNQTANINNTISQEVVTGRNTANKNNGNVTIKTGNIIAQAEVKSGPINIANISIPTNANGLFIIKIAGNGANSVNVVNANENNIADIDVNNTATIINNLKEKYITGNNDVNKNNGNVTIVTGDVNSSTNVENGPINASTVTVACSCEKENNKPTPPPAPTQPANTSLPVSSSSTSTSSGSSSGGAGSVLGASANNLPVTGGSYWFFIALIGNILMMLLGGYLRLRSGRSPGFGFAF